MQFDSQSITTEGYVLLDPAGNYLHLSRRETHTGHHVDVVAVRLAQADIFSSPWGPLDHPYSREGKAIRQYQLDIPDGTLQSVHVVRTSHITVTEAPLDPGVHPLGG